MSKFPKQVKKPEYSHQQHGKHKIKAYRNKSNKYYKIKTYFKPSHSRKQGDDSQSLATDGKYFYIAQRPYNSHNPNAKVRIIKYRKKHKIKIIKSGPKLGLYHAQSLTYSYKYKALFSILPSGILVKINTKSLKITKRYKCVGTNKYPRMIKRHILTIDNEGRFYTASGKGKIFLLVAKIEGNKLVTYDSTGYIAPHFPGKLWQNMSYDSVQNRIYLISDNAFYSYPVEKLFDDTLTNNDVQYTIFKSKRETEALTFDKNGKLYLLSVKASEVFKQY